MVKIEKLWQLTIWTIYILQDLRRQRRHVVPQEHLR
jgi:hypothetical protein